MSGLAFDGWAQNVARSGVAPLFEVDGLEFYGWHKRPSDKKVMGVFRESVFGSGGCISLENFQKHAEGKELTGNNTETAIKFAKQAVACYPA